MVARIEVNEIKNQNSAETTGRSHLLRTLRRKLLPAGLAVVLGLGGAGVSDSHGNTIGSESGANNTPTDITSPAQVELIPLAKPGDDKVELIPLAKPGDAQVELIPLAKPTKIDPTQQT